MEKKSAGDRNERLKIIDAFSIDANRESSSISRHVTSASLSRRLITLDGIHVHSRSFAANFAVFELLVHICTEETVVTCAFC